MPGGVVRAPAVGGGEALGQVHDLERERARQQAGLDREHAVVAAALVQSEPRRARIGGARRRVAGVEAELHLVAVAVHLGRRDDRAHLGRGDAADALERLHNLTLLDPALLVVAQVLEAAAAAAAEVRARRLDPRSGGPLDRLEPRLGPAAPHARDARAHRVAGESPVHEHDTAFVPGQCLAAQHEVLDLEV